MSFSTYAVVLTGAFSFGIGYFINIESNHAASGGETVESYKCLPKQFSTVVVSWEPLLIHIDNFITPFEVEHLISIANFEPSSVGSTNAHTDYSIRRSNSAILPDALDENTSEPVVECMMRRAAAFQGYVPLNYIEPLQLVKYREGEYYQSHYDAWQDRDPADGNRMTSFFVILKSEGLLPADGHGDGNSSLTAGTRFPRLRRMTKHLEACKILECDEVSEDVIVKPMAGSAVFWKNLQENGTIHPGSLHQGMMLPNTTGHKVEKIGMNIWTWNKPYL